MSSLLTTAARPSGRSGIGGIVHRNPCRGGNNFPLRGNKATLWEGGTRAAALVHGSMLAGRGAASRQLLHVTDWLPTLVSESWDGVMVLVKDGMESWLSQLR